MSVKFELAVGTDITGAPALYLDGRDITSSQMTFAIPPGQYTITQETLRKAMGQMRAPVAPRSDHAGGLAIDFTVTIKVDQTIIDPS